ncbi:unnamed protein product [Prorocentrum cordatum]|nr:unnamed protein product [Polarella glacialis]
MSSSATKPFSSKTRFLSEFQSVFSSRRPWWSASSFRGCAGSSPLWTQEAPASTVAAAALSPVAVSGVLCTRPPIRPRPSSTSTDSPARRSSAAAASPAAPAPTTTATHSGDAVTTAAVPAPASLA